MLCYTYSRKLNTIYILLHSVCTISSISTKIEGLTIKLLTKPFNSYFLFYRFPTRKSTTTGFFLSKLCMFTDLLPQRLVHCYVIAPLINDLILTVSYVIVACYELRTKISIVLVDGNSFKETTFYF